MPATNGPTRPPRSLLAVPASNARLMASAPRRPADALMLDLEDGVAPELKTQARESLLAFLDGADPALRIFIRVNDPSTEHGQRDLAALTAHVGRVNAVVVPKATPDAVERTSRVLPSPVVALIETAAGAELAAATASRAAVCGLLFGSVDYTADITRHAGWHLSDLSWVKSRIVNAAAAGEAWALAGGCTLLDDVDALAAEVADDAAAGFGGKLCLHPKQLDPVNDAFTPSPEQQAWAQRVIAAAAHAGAGAIRVDGAMVDKPVVDTARLIAAAVPDRDDHSQEQPS